MLPHIEAVLLMPLPMRGATSTDSFSLPLPEHTVNLPLLDVEITKLCLRAH
jgi:hypothetical protein